MLSDCEKCWDTPCGCGWYYRYHSDEKFKALVDKLDEGRKKIRASPEFKAEGARRMREKAEWQVRQSKWAEEQAKMEELRKLYDPTTGKWRKK